MSVNDVLDNHLILWNNYIEQNIRLESQSDLYSYCVSNTDSILNILSRFDPNYRLSLDIRPGWIPLILSLHYKILSLVDDYLIYQIKEKFGTLRYYAEPRIPNGYSPENKHHILTIFNHLIQSAENDSAQICELCSRPGTLFSENSWYKTRCNDCS
jgi:hypothetical protein